MDLHCKYLTNLLSAVCSNMYHIDTYYRITRAWWSLNACYYWVMKCIAIVKLYKAIQSSPRYTIHILYCIILALLCFCCNIRLGLSFSSQTKKNRFFGFVLLFHQRKWLCLSTVDLFDCCLSSTLAKIKYIDSVQQRLHNLTEFQATNAVAPRI